MNNIKYSVVILVKNYNHFENTLESICKQKYDLNKIELIVIDFCDNKVINEIVSHYKENLKITYKKVKYDEYINSLNEVINASNGEFITFINSDCYYQNTNIFHKIDKLKNYYDILSINSKYNDIDNNMMRNYKIQPVNTMEIDLLDNPHLINYNFNSYFFSKKIISDILFNSNYLEECFPLFLINVLEKKSVYYFINDCSINSYEPFETNTSKNSIQYNKWWYNDSLDRFIAYAKEKKDIPLYLQEFLLYIIHTKINCNIYDRNKNVLSKEESIIFMNKVISLCEYIDDKLILRYISTQKTLFDIQRWLRYYIVKRKNGKIKKSYYSDNNFVIEFKNGKIIKNKDIENELVKVYAINYSKGKLKFDCTTSVINILDEKDFKIYAKYNNEEIPVTRSYFYPLLKVFGKTLAENYCFNFTIDIENSKGNLEVFARVNDKDIPLKFTYAKVQAHLCNSKRSFWHYKDFVLYNKVLYIEIKKAKRINLIKSELLFDLSKLKNVRNKKRVLSLIFLRMLYYVTSPFYKNKHIWLTWDKLYKAGDNGEYMYQYCLKKNRNIYYFVKKDSPDYKRLKKQNKKRCVKFNSIKAKLLSLHSEVILDTHANVISYCGFDGISKHFACGLFNPEIICIQHGLTIQKIAQYQNRLFDNIKFYCCASPFEIDNIKDPLYDYNEDQMSLTGLARYDGLKTKEEKIILITPTWRRNVVNSSVAHIKKKHNDNFKSSDYFTIYNSLINNKKLIECAKKTGYKIIYLLHPAMSGQLEDFTRNDFVDIIPATGNINYEDILTRSSLMVTDYSGVQFDFAYQRKVLVYYHPDALPPHYDAGGLDYETMGFGPICKNEEQIVDELCENMKNKCKIKDEYKRRADDFFAYDDFDNCKRILNQIDKYLESIKM